jgi:RNA polymerase sigma-70 factor (ECF subfamily)
MPADSPTPDRQADVSQVLPALAKVDGVYQAAVALYYLNDCSYNEIAAVLEVPVGTVKSRIARGITQLREILNGNQFHVDTVGWDSSAAHIAEPIVA